MYDWAGDPEALAAWYKQHLGVTLESAGGGYYPFGVSDLFLDDARGLENFGVVAVLIPRFPVLKEWAYAGFFFAMTGAAFLHIAVGDPTKELVPSLLLVTLTMDRKIPRAT